MSEYRFAKQAARLLRAARARVGPHSSASAEDAIAAVADAIQGVAARRRRRRVVALVGTAGIGLCLAAALMWFPSRSRSPSSTSPLLVAERTSVATLTAEDGQVRPLLVGQEWRAGERLRSDAFPVALATSDQTTIEVEPRSDLQLVRAGAERWLRLGGGAVSVHVTKLKAGERFVIATPDAQVEVRGTRFQVALAPPLDDCGGGTVTRVSVTEGVVVVRAFGRESRVEAGDRWPTGCPDHSVPASAPPVTTDRLVAPPRTVSGVASARRSVFEKVSPSTLGTENDLFSSALKAESAGDRREAVQLLDVLLRRFPETPLKESASAMRARLIGSTQPPP